MIRLLVLGVVVTGVALLGLRLFAPQVLVLAREGFPPSVLPTRGAFAEVGGGDAPLPRALRPLPEAAARRFASSKGRALLVVQDGVVVQEAYGLGAGPETRLNSYSLVKSLVGLLVLKAVAEGRIASLEVSLRALLGPEAPEVTLDEVLRMTSGLSLQGEPPKEENDKPADDAAFSPFSPVARLQAFGVERMLGEFHPDPGLRGDFHYQSVNTALLGLVLERVHGQPLERILSEGIWQPAGAGMAQWRKTPGVGRVSAWCCLYARAEDWARVGLYVMTNGGDEPLLPEPLWRQWLFPEGAPVQYGWHLRHDVLDRTGEDVQGRFAYLAGHKGQRVYMLPERGTLVVRFGEEPQLLHSTLYEIVE